jgi:hypothetical protein
MKGGDKLCNENWKLYISMEITVLCGKTLDYVTGMCKLPVSRQKVCKSFKGMSHKIKLLKHSIKYSVDKNFAFYSNIVFIINKH